MCCAAPHPPAASPLLCGGWMSWRPHSCAVPKCHRGSCPQESWGLPHTLSLFPPLNTISSCVNYVTSLARGLDVAKQSHTALKCQPCMAGPFQGAEQWRREKGFVSNNDIIDRLEQDQDHSVSAISRNSLKPSVHYGTEPLFLRLASSLVFDPAPKAVRGNNPAKSRLSHPELDAELDLGERLI